MSPTFHSRVFCDYTAGGQNKSTVKNHTPDWSGITRNLTNPISQSVRQGVSQSGGVPNSGVVVPGEVGILSMPLVVFF